jgi:hypothetical protein
MPLSAATAPAEGESDAAEEVLTEELPVSDPLRSFVTEDEAVSLPESADRSDTAFSPSEVFSEVL